MILPYDDPIVQEKHKTQKKIMDEAGGDIKRYSKIVEEEADKLRKEHKGKFKKIVFDAQSKSV